MRTVRRLQLVLLAVFAVSSHAQVPSVAVLSVGHSGRPSRATFAGNLFITIAGANAHVVDLTSGLTIARLPQDGLALAVEASPDGERVAVATCGHTILVWDLRTLRLLHRLQTRSECADSVAWSPDGALLAAGTYGSRRGVGTSVQLWDARTGQLAREIDAAWKARHMVFAGNGAWLAAVDDDTVHILAWPSGREIHTFEGLESAGGLGSPALASPDGRFFGWVDGGSLVVWDVTTGARVPLPDARDRTVLESQPGWPTNGSRQTSVPARIGQFLEDGRLAYVADDTLVTQRLADGTAEVRPLPQAPVEWFGDVGFRLQHAWLAIRGDGALVGGDLESRAIVWEAATGRTRRPTAPPMVGPRSLKWSARDIVAWGGLGSAPRGWDARQGRLVTLAAGVESSEQLAFSHDGRRLAVSGGLSGTHVVDATRRRVEASLDTREVSALAFEPGGSRLAFVGPDGLGLFDLRLRLQQRVAGADRLEHLAWSPDGQWIAASTTGGPSRVRVWRADGSLPARTLHEWRFYESAPLAFSPDGMRLAAIVRGRDLTFWDTSTWAVTGTRQLPVTTRGLVFSPTGKQVAVAGWGESSVWNVDNGTRAFTLDTRGSPVVDEVAWSPDGRHLVTAGDDGVLVFWNAATGRIAGSLFVLDGQDEWLFVTPDGRMDGSRLALDTLVAWRTASGIALDARATRGARVNRLWRAVIGASTDARPR